jgi:hypothetical protein
LYPNSGIGLFYADPGFFDGKNRVFWRIGSKPFLWRILKTGQKARCRNVIEPLCISENVIEPLCISEKVEREVHSIHAQNAPQASNLYIRKVHTPPGAKITPTGNPIDATAQAKKQTPIFSSLWPKVGMEAVGALPGIPSDSVNM